MTCKESRRIMLASGEELLLLAVLGNTETVTAIDVELDRRARVLHRLSHQRHPTRRIRRPAA